MYVCCPMTYFPYGDTNLDPQLCHYILTFPTSDAEQPVASETTKYPVLDRLCSFLIDINRQDDEVRFTSVLLGHVEHSETQVLVHESTYSHLLCFGINR